MPQYSIAYLRYQFVKISNNEILVDDFNHVQRAYLFITKYLFI